MRTSHVSLYLTIDEVVWHCYIFCLPSLPSESRTLTMGNYTQCRAISFSFLYNIITVGSSNSIVPRGRHRYRLARKMSIYGCSFKPKAIVRNGMAISGDGRVSPAEDVKSPSPCGELSLVHCQRFVLSTPSRISVSIPFRPLRDHSSKLNLPLVLKNLSQYIMGKQSNVLIMAAR